MARNKTENSSFRLLNLIDERYAVYRNFRFQSFFRPEYPDLIFSSLDHFPELVQADLVVAGSITGAEDPVGLNLVHVLHHLEGEIFFLRNFWHKSAFFMAPKYF